MKTTNFKILYILFFFLSFAFFGSQCKKVSNGPSGSDTTGERFGISGPISRVCNPMGMDTRDYKDIMVTLSGNVTKTSELDNMGYYQFNNVPSGTYLITASKPGYPDIRHYIKILVTRDSAIIYELSGTGNQCSWSWTRKSLRDGSSNGSLIVEDMYLVLNPVNHVRSLNAIAGIDDSIYVSATTDSLPSTNTEIPVIILIGNDPDVSASHFVTYEIEACYNGHVHYDFDMAKLVKFSGFQHGQTAYITACVGGMVTNSYFNPSGFEVFTPVSASYNAQKVIIP